MELPDYKDGIIWNAHQEYRLNTENHGRFHSVNLSNVNLSNNNWPRIIDEALRALIPDVQCVLNLIYSNDARHTLDELMQQIFLFCRGDVSLLSNVDRGRNLEIKMLVRTRPRNSQITSLTIGVITDGKNDFKLNRFLESVDALKINREIQIETILCGPDTYSPSTSILKMIDNFIPTSEPSEMPPMVTVKKNSFAPISKFENILICHDRYFFSEEIIETLQNFGGDFDVCTIKAIDLNGVEFPHWTAFNNDWVNGLELAHDDFDANVFLNGGIFLVKKQLLLEVPLNPLLYWGYGEDIEWSRRLQSAGYTPKFIDGQGLFTEGHRGGYFHWFLPKSSNSEKNFVPQWNERRNSTIGYFPLSKNVTAKNIISNNSAMRHGFIAGLGARFLRSGIELHSHKREIAFSFYLEAIPQNGLNLSIEHVDFFPEQLLDYVLINGVRLDKNQITLINNKINIPIEDKNLFPCGSSSVRISLFMKNDLILKIKSIHIDKIATFYRPKKLSFGLKALESIMTFGWHPITHGGAWTTGLVAEIALPIDTMRSKYTVKINGSIFLNSEKRQTLRIANSGLEVYFKNFEEEESGEIEIVLPSLRADNSGFVFLTFEVGDPTSPFALGISPDNREIGFELRKVDFVANSIPNNITAKLKSLLSQFWARFKAIWKRHQRPPRP